MIETVLAESRGRVSGPLGAAAKLGIPPTTQYDEAKKQGWIVISMKNDWKVIFPFERK
jgi:hypothetical protein